MQLTKDFNLNEFTISQTAIRHGIDNTPDQTVISNLKKLACLLQDIREIIDTPINISSGFRCKRLNTLVGGASNSDHLIGYAADITAKGYTPLELGEFIFKNKFKFDQLIIEGVSKSNPHGSWVHISGNPKMRNEVLSAEFINGKAVYRKGF